MKIKQCCDGGGPMTWGCYHDHCTGPIWVQMGKEKSMLIDLTEEQYKMIIKMVKGSPLYEEWDKEPVLDALRKADTCGMSKK